MVLFLGILVGVGIFVGVAFLLLVVTLVWVEIELWRARRRFDREEVTEDARDA